MMSSTSSPYARRLKIISTEIRMPQMIGFPEKFTGSAIIR
jgi:hypothetical protein